MAKVTKKVSKKTAKKDGGSKPISSKKKVKKELKAPKVSTTLRADSASQLLHYSIQTGEDASDKLKSLPKKDLKFLVDLFNMTILGHLENGGKVQFMPFYTLGVKARLPRKGRNPRTGEDIQIKGSRYVSFRQGKGLKELMNADQVKVKRAVDTAKKEKEEKELKASKKKATNKKKKKVA